MPSLIVTQFMTLDGVVEAPGGETTHRHSGWTMPYSTDDLRAFKLREVQEAGSLLLGRRTFEQFAAAWPEREGPFADKMNAMPKTVVTSRPGELEWNATALVADRQFGGVRAAVQALKEGGDGTAAADGTATTDGTAAADGLPPAPGGAPILVPGSASLVRSLLVWGLVDELRLLTYPLLVGGGVRIFPDDREKWAFELTALERFESGAVLHVYRLAGS